MARRSRLKVKPAGGTGSRPGVSRDTASGFATTPEVSNLDTFTSVVSEWKHLVDYTRHQLEILNDLNFVLRKEITVLALQEAQARHAAYHDGLTGLPNRSLLQDRFHQAKSQAQRHHKPLALLLLDLDKFKQVNDSLGHASGDKLLQAVAQRLAKSIRLADSACRYGGDEFIIILPEIDTPASATALAGEIRRWLCVPYVIDGHLIKLSISIGVAVYPGDGQTFDTLMRHADIAMYRAKRATQNLPVNEQHQGAADRPEGGNSSAAGESEY